VEQHVSTGHEDLTQVGCDLFRLRLAGAKMDTFSNFRMIQLSLSATALQSFSC